MFCESFVGNLVETCINNHEKTMKLESLYPQIIQEMVQDYVRQMRNINKFVEKSLENIWCPPLDITVNIKPPSLLNSLVQRWPSVHSIVYRWNNQVTTGNGQKVPHDLLYNSGCFIFSTTQLSMHPLTLK